MLANRRTCPPIQRRHQGGAVAMITVLFLLIVVGFTVLVSLNMSGSDVSDSTSQHNSVQALFLAESGVERASQRYGSGTPCNNSLQDSLAISFAGGSLQVITPIPAVVSGLCQIRVRGVYAGTTRTVDAGLSGGGGGAIAFDAASSATGNSSPSWSHTVAAGSNRVLIVGVSLRNNSGQTVTGVTYGGTALTLIGAQNGGTNSVRVELWRLVAPAAGTATVAVTVAARTVGGAISLTGVDQTNPIEASQFANGSNLSPSVTVTTVNNNAWVVDTLAHRLNPTVTVGAGQTQQWNAATGGGPVNGAGGSGSHEGPISPVGGVPMTWSMTSPQDWAIGAVALKPAGGGVNLRTWTEVVP